ncbi:hypothetical protein DIZ76_017077 [Coccidioides immitis]|nr:hypothetical protein DIZ76_017077 [Coccidioides immitis]
MAKYNVESQRMGGNMTLNGPLVQFRDEMECDSGFIFAQARIAPLHHPAPKDTSCYTLCGGTGRDADEQVNLSATDE